MHFQDSGMWLQGMTTMSEARITLCLGRVCDVLRHLTAYKRPTHIHGARLSDISHQMRAATCLALLRMGLRASVFLCIRSDCVQSPEQQIKSYDSGGTRLANKHAQSSVTANKTLILTDVQIPPG